jgi:anti-sigma regulatory factor (Ser/Thr protein kinase)
VTDHYAAELLASELATNAVEHAHSSFEIRIDLRPAVVRVEIANDAPELLALVNQHPSAAGGYGLRLVESLSQHWGTESATHEKVVWFELARS